MCGIVPNPLECVRVGVDGDLCTSRSNSRVQEVCGKKPFFGFLHGEVTRDQAIKVSTKIRWRTMDPQPDFWSPVYRTDRFSIVCIDVTSGALKKKGKLRFLFSFSQSVGNHGRFDCSRTFYNRGRCEFYCKQLQDGTIYAEKLGELIILLATVFYSVFSFYCGFECS